MNRDERRRAEHHRRKWDLKIAKLIRDCNDCCSSCARPFAGMEKTFLGFSSDHQLMYVGTCCSSKVKLVIAEGVAITDQQQVQFLSREDLDWFAVNPRRCHRVRPPLAGELFYCELPLEPKVIVRKIKPEVHHRVVVGGGAAQTIPDEEAILKVAYDLALKAHEVSRDPAEITKLTAQYLLDIGTTSS